MTPEQEQILRRTAAQVQLILLVLLALIAVVGMAWAVDASGLLD